MAETHVNNSAINVSGDEDDVGEANVTDEAIRAEDVLADLIVNNCETQINNSTAFPPTNQEPTTEGVTENEIL